MTQSSSSLRPRLLLLVAAVALLSACNPLAAPVPTDRALIVEYTGPSSGWFELSFSGFDGFEVHFMVNAYYDEARQRLCRDAASGEVEACIGYPGLVSITDTFVATAAYRAAMSPFDADFLILQITCIQGAATVACPASLHASLRVVDAEGDPVGDLTRRDF